MANTRDRRQQYWDGFIDDRGERYRDCRFTNFQIEHERQRTAVAQVESFVKSMRQRAKGLVLIGPTGTGKDHLMAAAVHAGIALRHLTFVRWTSGAQLFTTIRSTFDDRRRTSIGVLRPLINTQLLCLSDLCDAGNTLLSWQIELVSHLIDKRYSAGRPIWATFNADSFDTLKTMVSAPIVDRLVDGSVVVACSWPSYRKPLS